MLRIAMCQVNSTVGALGENRAVLLAAAQSAAEQGADLALFPELALCGYPPEDLLLKPRFARRCWEELKELAAEVPIPCLVGVPHVQEDGMLYNAAALVGGGQGIQAVYHKQELPNYAVFDEKRYFACSEEAVILSFDDHRLGVVICEDAWQADGPVDRAASAGATAILCLNASPFHRNKHREREEMAKALCLQHGVSFFYCNLVGGQDELVFDGGSFALEADGRVIARGPEFAESVFSVDLIDPVVMLDSAKTDSTHVAALAPSENPKPSLSAVLEPKLPALQEIYECLLLGVRDYVHKNGFQDVVIGSSGGIDSALTACIAVDALGAEHVTCVSMPSRYSSEGTKGDAERLSDNLGTRFLTVPIHEAFATYLEGLAPHFGDREPDLTEENLQARIRGVYLMALANKFGWLVLNTSNKSESAVGYGTMYGDMIGAYGVLKDVFKTTVFALSYYVNERHGREVLPVSIIERPPSAELRPDQKDSDSLPDYDLLDRILEAYIEEDRSVDEMVGMGLPEAEVKRAVRLTDINEWKRRQSVPGVRVTPRAFGKDRRMPITNRYSG
ncbi:MAG: NAD+ synthase [Planctomycetota bacterium]